MSGITVGGQSRYMLATKHEDGSIDLMATTLHEICALIMRNAPFVKDVDGFESHEGSEVYMLIRGNILVPEIKIKVGEVEVDARYVRST